jgi:hypothetical protein
MLSPLPSVNARRSALSRSLNTGARAMPNSVRRINFASLTEKRRKPDQQMIGAASKRSRMLETSRTRQEGECQKNRIPVGEIATFRWGNPTPKTERYRWGKSPLQPYLKNPHDSRYLGVGTYTTGQGGSRSAPVGSAVASEPPREFMIDTIARLRGCSRTEAAFILEGISKNSLCWRAVRISCVMA